MSVPLGACCVSGHATTATPSGETVKLAGVDTYVAKPKGSYDGKAVVLATDVFGLNLNNIKIIADKYAEVGNFLVVVPDLFGGKAVPANVMDLVMVVSGHGKQAEGWLAQTAQKVGAIASALPSFASFYYNHPSVAKKLPLVDGVLSALRSDYGVTKIGMQGYCYGGAVCFHFSKIPGKIDAFVTAHTKILVPKDVEESLVPGLFLLADNDMALPEKDRRAVEDCVAKRPEMESKFYPGTYHGFASRGDETNPEIQAAMDDACQQALTFFKTHL